MHLADGRRVFVKAIGAECTPQGPSILRSEARVMAALPPCTPAPRNLGFYDGGDWVGLVLEDIEGSTPTQPWDLAELDRVLDALYDLAVTMTPTPIDAPLIVDRWKEGFAGWRKLTASADLSRLAQTDAWAARNIEHLARLESTWPLGASGSTLLHSDVRADNILLTRERVVFVDWPWVCVGAPWVDLVLMLPSVAMQHGGDPEQIVQAHPLTCGVEADAITAVLTAVTGFFIHESMQPPPPGLPTLRAFQHAQGLAGLTWLRRRLRGDGSGSDGL
jgi:aminoglycoside phosphotransferase (APT) family kinase protein